MNINIFRRRFTPWSVDGTMVIGGKIFCDTLERPNRHLPAGRYKISLIPTKQRRCRRQRRKISMKEENMKLLSSLLFC